VYGCNFLEIFYLTIWLNRKYHPKAAESLCPKQVRKISKNQTLATLRPLRKNWQGARKNR
jgi:hypothetical protein